jgi:hypothetical protein
MRQIRNQIAIKMELLAKSRSHFEEEEMRVIGKNPKGLHRVRPKCFTLCTKTTTNVAVT